MPWYKVPLAVYLPAQDAEEARERVLELLCSAPDDEDRPMAEARAALQLTPAQEESRLRLREILRRAAADSESDHLVSDGRYPGIRFTPAAAAELAALEFEEQQEI